MQPEAETELDDFGLPIKKRTKKEVKEYAKEKQAINDNGHKGSDNGSGDEFESADEGDGHEKMSVKGNLPDVADKSRDEPQSIPKEIKGASEVHGHNTPTPGNPRGDGKEENSGVVDYHEGTTKKMSSKAEDEEKKTRDNRSSTLKSHDQLAQIIEGGPDAAGVSEWSHQALTTRKLEEKEAEEEDWQNMPAYGKYDLYDDDGRLVARGVADSDDEDGVRGGARKGYTRVQIDEDAKSATSMDDNTNYLFKEKGTTLQDDDDEARDPLAQMEATKDLLTEGQRIAYVGVTRLSMLKMIKAMAKIEGSKSLKKDLATATESTKMWSQKMMVRLYTHMEIDSSEQVMIEQLGDHGVEPSDLTPALMLNSRVKNPMVNQDISTQSLPEEKPGLGSRRTSSVSNVSANSDKGEDAPPAYEMHTDEDLPEVRNPTMLPDTQNIDIDLRWTVLCDLFLVLIADSIYDSRSRVLLETVGLALEIPWIDICRFEKRVTDALEMQEAASRENWDEAEHMESRRKLALKKRYMVMGLATVGGSLVIGLSAGLLAPVIGAGLAAGFTTIGVAGTTGFLAGAGGTAIITTGSALSGGFIAVRASNRRMGAVKTFEYRPLHNNKRVNLIITVSGWMNGKVDDVRLPFSTVDPIMGDVYSVLWEPDVLQSMGDTIRILATEALTQGLQQVLASTILTALMASLSLPIVLTKLSYLLDNPWSVSQDRADAAGLILADSIVDRNLGVRPITLVGFSLGSRVIFSCLKELAKKGAYGLVQNVYLFGSPLVAKKEDYLRVRTVISGRFVNAYATNDWIIGYLFRATSGGISRVAGLAAVEDIPGLENIDVTSLVNGHMAYRTAMPRLLREVGWEVESDEFTEIEDPDPDNHEARQRELIKEIETARKEAEGDKSGKRKSAWWRRAPKEKKAWETYDDKGPLSPGGAKKGEGSGAVLFDIEAIRAELEAEHFEVRQLESTLPPMRLDLNAKQPRSEQLSQVEFPNGVRPTRSFDASAIDVKRQHNFDRGGPESGRSNYDEYDEYDEHQQGSSVGPTVFSEPAVPPVYSPRESPVITRSASELRSPAPQQQQEIPELRSVATTPIASGVAGGSAAGVAVGSAAGGVGLGLERNAWVDEEDEFAPGGGQMSMTFE